MVHTNITSEGGVFVTGNPLKSPLSMFLVQAVLIIALSRLIHAALFKLRQPRVIAEVIGGICLGPSVLGNIPGFTSTIFFPNSLPLLQLVSNVGLILYLFLVGLELEPQTLFRDLRRSVPISTAGIILPFGLGAAVSYGLYTFVMIPNNDTPLSSFILFTGVAMSITAFPVLARILTEFKLLSTPVGQLTITAAAIDDCCAWSLLALVVSIMNGGDNLTALYIILVAAGYAFILLVPFRILFRKVYQRLFANRKSETMNQVLLTFILVCVLVSGWFTELIGIHAIFGGFLMGLTVPREDKLPLKLTEKIEDLITIVFLPVFFASSGLKTRLSLLNDGATWGWLFLVIAVACFGKICGCTIASRISGIPWRESFSVGILMNTKGLVELIVLNIGYDAGVINARIFAIMVVMALVTTFITSPLISYVYPPHRQKQLAFMGVHKPSMIAPAAIYTPDVIPTELDAVRLLVYVDTLESMPIVSDLIKRFSRPPEKISITALKISETSERSSSILYASMAVDGARHDPALQVAAFIGHSHGITTTTFLTQSPPQLFGEEVNNYAMNECCNLLLIPWHYAVEFDTAPLQISSILTHTNITTGIYIDSERDPESWFSKINEPMKNRILVPFVGGGDDREALRVALRLHRYGAVTLHVMVQQRPPDVGPVDPKEEDDQLADFALLESIGVLAKSSPTTLVIATGDAVVADLAYGLIIVGRSHQKQADLLGGDFERISSVKSIKGDQPASAIRRSFRRQISRQFSRLRTKGISRSESVFGRFEEKIREAQVPILVISRAANAE